MHHAAAQARSRAAFGQGTGPILLDNLACTGNEARLFDCPNNGIGIHNCAHSEDAGVVCNQTCECDDWYILLFIIKFLYLVYVHSCLQPW